MPVGTQLDRENSAPAACDHCGSPVPEALRATRFCCAGCAAVYALLRNEGLGRYYDFAGKKTLPIGPAPVANTHNWLEPVVAAAEATEGTVCSLEIDVQGIHCSGCVWLMNETFRRTKGSVAVTVNPTLGKVRLVWRKGVLDLGNWICAIERFGYRFGPSRKHGASATSSLTWRLGICVALSMNVMLFSLSFYFGLSRSDEVIFSLFTWLSMLLSGAVAVIGGEIFFRSAWLGLRRRVLAMDLPISLGIALVFGASVAQVLSGRGGDLTYFDTLNTFVTLMLLGRWLQQKAIERNRTLLLDDDGAEGVFVRRIDAQGPTVVRAPQLRKGDQVLVAPGELVPVDATLIEGSATVSTDWITGESEARQVEQAQRIAAGSFNAGRTPFKVQAETDFSESQLSTLLRAPTNTRGPLKVALWDRLARWWSASVLALSAGGFGLWWLIDRGRSLDVATALLVITCPCALGISLPLARELVQLRLRKQGFFTRDPALLDKLVKVTKLVFDKTGTLTLGYLEATNVAELANLPKDVRDLAYTMATQSAHPVSVCLAAALKTAGATWLASLQVSETAGAGLQASTEAGVWRLGKPGFALLGADQEEGSVLGTVLSCNGTQVARFTTREVLRADAQANVRALGEQGFKVYLMSGDQVGRVKAMAQRLGVSACRAFGALSPEQKAAHVSEIDAGDTLFLGDGVNDTLAFDRASVAGTVAVDRPVLPGKASFFLLGEGLAGLSAALLAAKQLRQVTHRVLAISLSYNVFAVTACLFGAMTPLRAAITMPASSLFLLSFTLWSVGAKRPQRTQAPLTIAEAAS